MKKQKFMLKIMWMLMIVFVIGVVPCGLEAKASIVDSGTCGAEGNEENVTWTVDSGERILTVSGQGAIKDYADFYSGMKAPWHQYRRKIDKIVIEEGITCIGECAFGEMLETELVLPTSSLKEIKSGAFMWNSNLREIDLPETITVLGGGVFQGCKGLSEIEIPGSIKHVPYGAMDMTNLKKVVLHEGVVSTGKDWFGVYPPHPCLTRVYLPETLEQMDAEFMAESQLDEVMICGKSEAARRAAATKLVPYLDMLKKHDISSAEIVMLGYYTTGGKAPEDGVIFGGEEIEYVGAELRPMLRVKYTLEDGNQVLLQEGNEYEIIYANNIEPGKSTVTVRGKGNFFGEKSVNFDIYALIKDCDVNLSYTSIQYDGTEKKPVVEVLHKGKRLKEGENYLLEYENNIEEGTAKVIITGKNGYRGSQILTYQIYKKSIIECDINLSYESVQYDGTEKKPDVEVSYKGKKLEEGVDYALEYADNVEEGEAKVTITGKGGYKETKILTYKIYKIAVENCDINLSYESVQYDGTEKMPVVEVAYQGKELKEGTDYTLSYANNIEEGTAQAIITGIGAYKGTKVVTYQIYKNSIEQCKVNLAYTSVQADGTEKKPAVTVKDKMGNFLQENIDYTLEYQDTVYPGQATVKVSGKNLYKGTKSVPYQIEGISIEGAEFVLNETIFTYDGSAKRPSVSVTLEGKALILGTDYQVSYKDNVNEGTAYAIIEGTGIYTGAVSMSFTILPYSAGKESVYSQGDTFLSGNFVYEVMDDEALEVEVSSTSKKNLTKAVIPATIKCEGITYKVTSIGQKAFYKNTKIKSVEVGNNVTSIENYAFYGCKNMASLKLGKKVEVIGSSAFRKCTKLTAVTLPKSMEELGKNAFYGCSKLKTITINANSVIDIEEGAIKGISNKAVIKVPKKHYKKYQKKLTSRTGYKKKTMKLKKK
ncbi:leucine-rich repeat domain-containing protein [Roseburia sp. 1XD42-69]|uniref:leucine-rich repeat domain-containing protein n=1 Tax=Roseburia sp. 1XD42-69 TaxID=2320088 RepID=UPI000EA115BC|nr:leucine-rich repeat domain-containing protein [Roseburia sp. 1XD42-69]RKJ67080.1 leucine-rich repeat domain-containing protein [Roseburia sp. 1XD42-69]